MVVNETIKEGDLKCYLCHIIERESDTHHEDGFIIVKCLFHVNFLFPIFSTGVEDNQVTLV
jgi:hypothetical protein